MSEREIFTGALKITDPAEQAAYLDKACAGDSELRQRVQMLLQTHGSAGDFLERPAAEQLAAVSEPTDATQAFDASNAKESNMARTEGGGSDDDESDDLSFLHPATRPDSLGRIGHYEVLQVLGKGGFGTVFRAFDDVLHRIVAVKVMSPQLASTSPARKRFLREARSSAQVRHENVVQTYEIGEQPLPYIAMEFIPGETLQQRLDRVGPVEPAEVVRIGRQIAEGLAAAHATDLIHRDIKPGNVLLEGGAQRVKITDFGLARAADDASISQSGIIAGTPMYMAPEQAKGDTLDQRADLFSLGSVLYQMAAGRPPFRANGTLAVLKRVAEDNPRPIREVIPETPQWLCDIISKLHAKNPADRYQSAREVADVLADCEAQLKANAKLRDFSRIPQSKSPAHSVGRRKWAVAAALMLPILAVVITVVYWPRIIESITPNGITEEEPVVVPVVGGTPPLAIAPFDGAKAKEHQDAWAKHLGVEPEIINSIGMKLRLIPPGEFTMGSPENESGHSPDEFQHQVTITKPFRLGAYPVTVGQFKAFVKEKGYKTEAENRGGMSIRFPDWTWKFEPKSSWLNPGFDQTDEQPAIGISWNDAKVFCQWLSDKEGRRYDLPTEAQWEYACRAGTRAKFYGGKEFDALAPYVWDKSSSPTVTTPRVGQKKPNAWGLFDMQGNVWQWMADWYGADYYFKSPREDPSGPVDGQKRVMRGAVWSYIPGDLFTVAKRQASEPRADGHVDAGFRVILVGDLKAKASSANSPFVILARDVNSERKFATLAEAVTAAQSGDTIEIRGNGPFVAPAIKINGKALTIRAGADCQPVLMLDPAGVKDAGNFILTDAPLALEGLELQRLGKSEPPPTLYPILVNTTNNLSVANCRFLWHPDPQNSVAISCMGKTCEVRNCIVLGTKHGLFRGAVPAGTTSLTNSVFVCSNQGMGLYAFENHIAAGSHYTIQNTILAPYALGFYQFGDFAEQDKRRSPSARWETGENVLHAKDAVFLFGLNENQSGVNDVLLRMLAWQEKSNVYQAETPFVEIYRTGKRSLAGLPDWEQVGRLKNTGSTQGKIRYAGGDLWAKMKASPEKLVPADFLLHPDSAGKSAGQGGKDLGADVELVGPGAAYEKWRQTPEYREWQKKTDQIMAKTDEDAWLKRVAAMPADQQVDEVKAKLKDVNPGFDGDVKHKIEDGVVTELRIVTDNVTNIAPIQVFNSLRVLDCRGTHVNFGQSNGQLADLTPLKGMNLAGLIEIQLQWTKVNNQGLAHFKDCKDLTILDLTGTKVSAAGLAYFKDCKNLSQLWLGLTEVNNAGLARFEGCKDLTHLGLQRTQVGDAGLAHFEACKNLEHLWLQETKVTNAGLAYFRDCKNLTHLGLNNTKVGNAGLAYFKDCKGLTVLGVTGTQVDDTGLAHFKNCKNLTYVELGGTEVGDAGLEQFKDCKDLIFLDVRKTKVTATKIAELKKALPNCKIEWDGTPAKADAQPFVVLDAKSKEERKFATLADAVAGAGNGDTVEIRGNGPFEPAPMTLSKALTIRAGKDARPVLVHTTDGYLFRTTAPLTLEGLEIHSIGPKEDQAKGQHGLIEPKETTLRIVHCRILVTGELQIVYGDLSPRIELHHSQFHAFFAVVAWIPLENGRLVIENCVTSDWCCLFGIHGHQKVRNLSVDLNGNTLVARNSLDLLSRFFTDPAIGAENPPAAHRWRYRVTSNVIQSGLNFHHVKNYHEKTTVNAMVKWQGDNLTWDQRQNLYSVGDRYLYLVTERNGKPEVDCRTLKDWQTFCKLKESPGIEAEPQFRGGNLLDRMQKDPLAIVPADYRLVKGSPGQGAGPGGKDLGADVDRVGPGPAYERWKNTPEYQEWRKKADEK